MRSLLVPHYGPPEVLKLVEAPDPQPGDGEVRIKVARAGFNFSDVAARVGLYPDAGKPPFVLGYEVSGTVDAIGPNVANLKVGERVLAMCRFRGQATHVVTKASWAKAMPSDMSFDQGASLPVNYLTAYHMLFHVGTVRQGDAVLIHMAAGGVGMAAIELCRQVEGVTIFGTASKGKHDALRAAGVHHPIDYTTEDYADVVRRHTEGRGVSLVLDPLGGPDWHKGYELLKPAGHLIAFGWANMVSGERRNPFRLVSQFIGMKRYSPFALMNTNRTVSGVNLGHLWGEGALIASHLDALLSLFARGKLAPHVSEVFALSRAAEAHRYVQDRKNVGKVLYDPNS